MTMPNTVSSPHNLVLQDAIGRRLGWALLASLLGNLLLWRGVAAMARQPMHYASKPVEITRIILQPNGKRIEKTVIRRKIVPIIHKEIARPKPPVEKPVKPPPRPEEPIKAHQERPRSAVPTPRPQPPPPTAHNHVLTAPDTHAPTPNDHVVQSGGNADVGKPTNQQGAGDAKVNPDTVVKKEVPKPPEPQKPPDMPKVAIAAPPVPPPGNDIKEVIPPVKPPDMPKPPDPPKKKGPTREAQPTDQVNPDIPEELKHGDFKSFVRVAVDIDADGSFTVSLRTSSGNQDIDNRVLEALKKWKWKPALKNGEPIQSVQRFKFEFEVK